MDKIRNDAAVVLKVKTEKQQSIIAEAQAAGNEAEAEKAIKGERLSRVWPSKSLYFVQRLNLCLSVCGYSCKL